MIAYKLLILLPIMLSLKLFAIIILAASLLTTGALISKPAIAISKQNLKQQLLDKILNGTLTDTSDRINNIKSNVQKIKDKILNEVGIRLTKNEEKQVN